MRIGLVTDNLPWERIGGGIGTYTVLVAEELARRGIESHVFRWRSPEGRSTYARNGVTYHLSPLWVSLRESLRYGAALQVAKRAYAPLSEPLILRHLLQQFATTHPFDVIEFPDIDGYGVSAWRLRGVKRVAVRLHACSKLCRQFAGEPADAPMQPHDRLEEWAAHHAQVVTSVSHSALVATEKSWGRAIPGAKVVYNPIEKLTDPAAMPEREPQTVLFSGRLEPRKGVDTFARAIPRIAAEFPQAKFQIFGKPVEWSDGRLGDAIVQEILRPYPHLEGRVEMPGPIPRDQLLERLRRATVAVVPSLYENQPFAVLEAIACGTPLVVSDIPAHTEILTTEEQGARFPVNDEVRLACRVQELLLDAPRRATLGRNALERSRDFEIGTVVDQLLTAWGVAA